MYQIASLIAGNIGQDIGASVKRTRRNIILYCIAGLLFLTAYVSLVVSITTHVAATQGLVGASLVVAAAALVVAVVILAILQLLKYYEKKKQRDSNAARTLALTAVLALAPTLIRRRGLLATAAVAALTLYASGAFKQSVNRDKQEE